LKSLNLAGNYFDTIPVVLTDMLALTHLHVEENPLSELSPALAWKVIQRGSTVALDYMRSKASSMIWSQLKLIVLGVERDLATQLRESASAKLDLPLLSLPDSAPHDLVRWRRWAFSPSLAFSVLDFSSRATFEAMEHFLIGPRTIYLVPFRCSQSGWY
jgi:hypothetical protein